MIWTHGLYQNKPISFAAVYNYDHSEMYYASVVASPKFKWYQPTAELSYLQQNFHAPNDDGSLVKNKPAVTFSLLNQFVFSKTFMGRVNFWTRTRLYQGFQEANGFASLNLALRKSFYNERLILSLSANDIFDSMRERWALNGYGTTMDKDCNTYSRSVSLTVTYNFNAKRSKYKGTGAGNAEKNRL